MPNRISVNSGYAHPSTRYWIELIIEELSVNQETNTSEVFFDLRARSEVTWDLEFSGRLGYIEVNGSRIVEKYTNLGAWDGDGGKYNKRICSITKTIPHNEDGTMTLNVKGYYDYSNILISKKWWLSPVSVSTVYKTTPIENKPSLSLSISSQLMESVSIGWRTNISIKKIEVYDEQERLLTSANVDSKKAGSIPVEHLVPSTTYKFKVKVQSVGGVWSDLKTITIKTAPSAQLISELNYIFGDDLTIVKTNANSGTKDDLYFYVNGKLVCVRTDITNTYILKFTQSELDFMYKQFGMNDYTEIKATVVTNGKYESSQIGIMTLTGNAKTAIVGVKNKPVRAKVWYGLQRVPKRAVVWVGTPNGPKRCI